MRLEHVQVEVKSAKGQGRNQLGGAGETQLQVEQYNLKLREGKLNKALKSHQTKESLLAEKRERSHKTQPFIALIGYTNAGKSALTNLCTGSELESANMLFQTLNTSNRGLRLPNGQNAVLLDTVGFITDLPHGLVESFKATLDEIHFADVIVHVRDISHPQTEHQKQTVLEVLKDIGVSQDTIERKYLEVWNKIDLVEDRAILNDKFISEMNGCKHPIVPISCISQENLELLLDTIQDMSCNLMDK